MNYRRIYVTGMIFLLTLVVSLSNLTAQPVYATYGSVTITKKDPDHNRLPNWTFTLYKRSNGNWYSQGSKTTNSQGQVSWSNISYASYAACETLQTGWTALSPTDQYGCQYFTIGYGSSSKSLYFVNEPSTPPTRDIKVIKYKSVVHESRD